MVYRIHFETRGSYWCIQFQHTFFWSTVKDEEDRRGLGRFFGSTLGVRKFPTYEAAEKYVEESGIASTYGRKRPNSFMSILGDGSNVDPPSRAKHEHDEQIVQMQMQVAKMNGILKEIENFLKDEIQGA